MNFYNISQEPQRLQTAQHFHSSLEQPTIENVEAQLYVARQRNYELSMQYFQNKYGNSQLYNKYIENNHLEGLGAPEPQYDFRRELDKKALQIQQAELKKIQRKKEIGFKSRQDDDNGNQQVIKNRERGKQRKNIWIDQTRNKQHQIENHPAFEININKEKEGAFMSEFKNYLQNKKKLKEEQPSNINLTLDKSITTSQFKGTLSSLSPNKQLTGFSHKSKSKGRAEQPYEQQLVKKIYKDIAGKADHSIRLQKLQLIQYLNANNKILRVLEMMPEQVSKRIVEFKSKDSNCMSFNQCLIFVLGAMGKSEEIKRLKAQQEFEAVPQGCMLSKELLSLFQQAFKSMDYNNDLIIKRIPFIAKLTSDPLVKKNLNLPAVFQPQYSRHISLRRIFQRIEIETLLCSQQDKRLNEYISWNQFISYYQSGHKNRAKYDIIILLESLRNQEKFGLSNLSESIAEIINYAIKRADKGQELINTMDIINQIKLHKQYEIQKYTFIKRLSQQANNISDTFQDVLMRIKENASKFVSPKEFMEYFSVRGKPIEEFQKQRNQQQSKNLSAAKVTFIQNQIFDKQQQQVDGYDSDPQLYNSKFYENPKLQARKSQKEFKRFKDTAQSFIEADSKAWQGNQRQILGSAFKVTIPQPFSFEQREKQRRQNKYQPQLMEQKQFFKAGHVPSKVAQVGLYEKMIEEQKKKNQERRRCSMIMTLANQKPFSFLNRKANKKTKQQRNKFEFKAKPIPWFCSVDLLDKKKQEQIIRNERIAKIAQENLAKAKLPPRMEKDFLQKEAKKITVQNAEKRPQSCQSKVKQPPNFSQKHKEFQQALQRKRKQNKTTEIKQFKFSSVVKLNSSKIRPDSIPQQFFPKKHYASPGINSNIDVMTKTTKKFEEQVKKNRKEKQERQKKEQIKKKQDEERLKIDQELKQKVQQAAHKNKENKEKEEFQKRKLQNTKQNETFKEWKKSCVQKGRQQPLLIDRITKRDEKIQKMKRLFEISQTLKKNGIIGKEHDHYFKREQLLLLQDYEQLKDKI